MLGFRLSTVVENSSSSNVVTRSYIVKRDGHLMPILSSQMMVKRAVEKEWRHGVETKINEESRLKELKMKRQREEQERVYQAKRELEMKLREIKLQKLLEDIRHEEEHLARIVPVSTTLNTKSDLSKGTITLFCGNHHFCRKHGKEFYKVS